MAQVHNDLSSMLANVWENRETILYAKSMGEDDATIEDRVYAFYAPNLAVASSKITPTAYLGQLNGVTSPPNKAVWRKNVRGGFHVWDAGGTLDSRVEYRVYLNAKPECAVTVLKHIMNIASVDPPPPPRPPRPGLPTTPPVVVPEHVIRAGVVTRAKRGQFGEGLAAVKIADEEQAFTNRPDKLVVYTNKYGGETVATLLANELARNPNWFNANVPPMTRRIAMGVAVGPEVAGTQWNVGTSFGEVRCNLIARALLFVATGKTPDDLTAYQVPHPSGRFTQTRVPLPPPRTKTGSPNRLDFVNLVAKLFTDNGINPLAPWE
jgi:hypothetical protein